MECEHCEQRPGTERKRRDPWGRVYAVEVWCDECEDSWEPPEPDLNAVSARERQEMDWRAKRQSPNT